jgi:CheY-like chemotaxis protein
MAAHDAPAFRSIDLHETQDSDGWIERAFRSVQEQIALHQPHLILLDLRLRNEIGPMELEMLGGYQLLRKIKASPSLQGIPVIMFTASTNVQHIKHLLKDGAVSVWTKPGIDERLGNNEVIGRYQELIRSVSDILNYFRTDLYSELNCKVQKGSLMAFEQLRSKLLDHASYIKYRCALLSASTQVHFFAAYSDIFIDTNVMMTGIINKAEDQAVDFAETILNVFHLAQICGSRQQDFEVDGKKQRVIVPQLVIVNQVFDELMKLSKEVKSDQPTQDWKRALIGYDIIRSLFDGNYPVRTEYNELDKQGILSWRLLKPSDKHYADDPLRSYIKHIITGEQFVIKPESKDHKFKREHRIKILYPGAKVLLITNENPNSKHEPEKKLPNLVRKDLENVNDLDNRLTIMRLVEFNQIMKALPL